MSERKKRNIIIGSLCAVVLLMTVGYAAFSTVLNIQGTSNVTSNWNVKITNVVSKNIVGTASNNGNPTYTDTSATFKTNLVSPGDSIEYDITVTNAGSLNAKLDKYVLTDTNNSVIKFTQTGLTKGELLTAGNTKTFTVKVEYLSSVTSDPSSKTSNLTITLDYSQAPNGYVPGNITAAELLTSNLVTSGEGLSEATYESGRYIFKGSNPKNRIMLKEGSNDVLYRIVSVETDGTLKVIRDEKVTELAYDERTTETSGPRLNDNNTYCQLHSDGKYWGCNAWSAVSGTYTNGSVSGTVTQDSTVNNYLNTTFYNSLAAETKNVITDHNYDIGGVTYNWGTGTGMSLSELTTNQTSNSWSGKIGLVTVSDWFNAATSSSCVVESNGYYNESGSAYPCKDSNYLYKSGYWWWTISPYLGGRLNAFSVSSTGYVGTGYRVYNSGGVRPAFYLKSDITLSGEGTSSNPYLIN